jgi:hypothetical protein
MLGISLLKTLPMKEFIFTDCHYKVLNFLLYNLKINFPAENASAEKEIKEMEKCTELGPDSVFKESKVTKEDKQILFLDNSQHHWMLRRKFFLSFRFVLPSRSCSISNPLLLISHVQFFFFIQLQ